MLQGHLRIRFELSADQEGELVAVLWDRGCLGTESREQPGGLLVLDAWFMPGKEIETGLDDLGSLTEKARVLSRERVPARDWMAVYRAQVQPRPVGRRLIIDSREPDPEASVDPEPGELPAVATDRRVLRIPAREAFGTGSHESTRLVLEMLEELSPVGLRVLDVGAGSGVLSFAAVLFGARFVVGVEIDLVAALLAAQNRRLNDLYPCFVAGTLEALASSAWRRRESRFDLVLINVLPYRIRRHLANVTSLLAPGAVVVFSGIPLDEGPAVRQELADLGFHLEATRSEGEWLAFRLVNQSSPERAGAVDR